MARLALGFALWTVSGLWWLLFDRLFGDAVFDTVRAVISAEAARWAEWLIWLGPPAILVALGGYFFWKGLRSSRNSQAATLGAIAKGFRAEIVEGRVKAASSRWERKHYDLMLEILNRERVHCPELMSADLSSLTPAQIETLARYQSRERELDICIDDILSKPQIYKINPRNAANNFRHRLLRLSDALDRLITSLDSNST